MRSKYKWIFTLLMALSMQFSFAQEKTVTGVVSDASGTLPGANVVVKGTTRGTQTDINGKYSIKAKQGDVLVFSFVGMSDMTAKVGASNVVSVKMQDGVKLESVVVTAYGTQKKSAITGSVAEVKSKEIEKIQSGNVMQGLTGKIAGVQVVNNNGMPGDPPVIRFRGIGSLSASSSPLYVVDGVPFNSDIATIASHDIESMSFLKDAAAAALYGSRGANGVIIITTKKGSKGKVSVTLDTKMGVTTRATKEYDLMTAPSEYYEGYYKVFRNSILNGDPTISVTDANTLAAKNFITDVDGLGFGSLNYNNYNVPSDKLIDPVTGKINPDAKLLYNEDWNKYLFKERFFNQTHLNVSGGSDNSTQLLSLGYEKNEGYVINSDFEKITAKLRTTNDITKNFKISGTLSYANAKQRSLDGYTGGSAYSNPFSWTRSIAPIYPVHLYNNAGLPVLDVNGNHKYDDGTVPMDPTDPGSVRAYGQLQNPYATALLDIKTAEIENIFANYSFDYSITDDLKLVYNVTGDISNSVSVSLDTPLYGDAVSANGRGSYGTSRSVAFTQQQLLTYKKSFMNHNFDLLLGHESLDRKGSGISGSKTDFILPNSPWLDHAGKIQDLSNGGSEYGIEGYLSRLNYDFAGKYFLNASVRRDGSSRFAPENRWGTFYGFGAGWIVSKESWFSNLSWLNTFKLKASFGQQGNDNLGVNLPYLDQYGVILSTDSTPVGLVQSSLGNRNITWEKNSNINAGFDLNLFNDRLDIQAEYFNRSVSDMLFFRPLQPSSGFNVLPENSGDMKNEGAELTVRGDVVRTNDFGFTLSANATYVNNEITELPQERILTGSFIRTKGSSAYTYYLREFVGVNPLNGRSQFYKDEIVGGVATGNKVITENYTEATFYQQDKTALAKIYGGFDTALRYKNVDFAIAFAYQFGGYGYDSNYMNFFAPDPGQNLHRDIADTWTPENTTASLPMVDIGDTKFNYATSTMGLIKSDYISIQNLSAGYTFSPDVTKRLKLSSLRFYGLIDNVALWSKRQGYDPRLSLVGGSDNKYSLFRTISFGINVKF